MCPKCGRVYSPYTSYCNFCGNFDFSKVTCTTRLENTEVFGKSAKVQQPLGDLRKMSPIEQPLSRTTLKTPDGKYE